MLERVRSCLQRIPLIVTVIGGLTGIGFSVVYILVTLDVIRIERAPPTVFAGVSSVQTGRQVTVRGERLDRVAEIWLSDGGESLQVPFLLRSPARVLIAIHDGIPPGEYQLEFKTARGKTVSTRRTIAVQPRLAVLQRQAIRRPIMFANLNWNSARIQTAIARFIIGHGYDYPTGLIPSQGAPGRATDLWKGLVGGTIHVIMEVWLPDQQDAWDSALADAAVIPLGKSLHDQWQSAFVVPTYVIQGDARRGIKPRAPDLTSVADLRKYAEVFATPLSRNKAVLRNCPAIWHCASITPAQVRAYGLEEVITIQETSSAAELLRSLKESYTAGEPWLGYIWGPTTIPASRLGLTRLEEPPYAPECWKQKQCGYGTSRVMIAVHPSVIDHAPTIIHFLRRWRLNVAAATSALDYVAKTGGHFDQAARLFLQNQESVWTQWVPTDVAAKVKTALHLP